MKIELPDHLTARVAEREVFLDLAVGMYAAKRLTLGQAAELAGVSQGELQRELGRRQIPVHYDLEDLAHDLQAAAELEKGSVPKEQPSQPPPVLSTGLRWDAGPSRPSSRIREGCAAVFEWNGVILNSSRQLQSRTVFSPRRAIRSINWG